MPVHPGRRFPMRRSIVGFAVSMTVISVGVQGQQPAAPAAAAAPSRIANLEALKHAAASDVDGMRVMTQQMIDQVFSFGELGYQEYETSKYLTDVLRRNGFT